MEGNKKTIKKNIKNNNRYICIGKFFAMATETEPTPTPTRARLQYAEVTLIKSFKHRTFWQDLWTFAGGDEEPIVDKENDTVLMTFAGEPPFDTKDRYVDLNFKFTLGFGQTYDKILYIKNPRPGKDNVTYFLRDPRKDDASILHLDFREMTEGHPVYDLSKNPIKASCRNIILYQHLAMDTPNFFYFARLPSSDTMPRYVVAYDDTLLFKTEVIYLVRQLCLNLYLESDETKA